MYLNFFWVVREFTQGKQSNDVNALRNAADLSEEDHYMMMLVQTEVERMKFVVRSYVRTRLYKVGFIGAVFLILSCQYWY